MQNIKESILVEEGHCAFFYVKPGKYQATFNPGKHSFRVICFAHDVSVLFANQFPGLLQFITRGKETLESFQTCLMDTKFRSELSKLHPNSLKKQAHQTQFILIQLSKLLSTFKGLIQGRDRFSEEKKLVDNIILAIDSALKNHQSIRVSDLVLDFPITRRKLEKLFHSYLHIGPSAYIRKRKIERVQQLLISTDQSLLEISLIVGFSDVHSLNRTFKAYTGSTLSEFRKNNQSE
ncbi:helix-turn-helix domain-containing protein [Sphingobacterium sp.]|uniref:helix-turn-helix transcriptional regulator n=1 Tax=Sphingobacterium sp. TaxID=341027 RepID=UPI0028ABBA0C|nr:helix-turn-helix domain-containing protein [Sphingobacterium sp.]